MIDEQKKEKLLALQRNFNNEWMVKLWEDYHWPRNSKKFKLLYYDEKE